MPIDRYIQLKYDVFLLVFAKVEVFILVIEDHMAVHKESTIRVL